MKSLSKTTSQYKKHSKEIQKNLNTLATKNQKIHFIASCPTGTNEVRIMMYVYNKYTFEDFYIYCKRFMQEHYWSNNADYIKLFAYLVKEHNNNLIEEEKNHLKDLKVKYL